MPIKSYRMSEWMNKTKCKEKRPKLRLRNVHWLKARAAVMV